MYSSVGFQKMDIFYLRAIIKLMSGYDRVFSISGHLRLKLTLATRYYMGAHSRERLTIHCGSVTSTCGTPPQLGTLPDQISIIGYCYSK